MISGVRASPRNNSPEQLKTLVKAASNQRFAFLRRNAELDETLELLTTFHPPIVHLCGEEDLSYRQKIRKMFPEIEIWQTIGVPLEKPDSTEWADRVNEALKDDSIDQVVIDTSVKGLSGGTGKSLPFELIKSTLGKACEQIIFAGGLNPDKVVPLLETFTPAGVDVSSGIESKPGEKSPELLKTFISRARKGMRQ